ncbi:MAG: hypothetical protein WAL63_05375 [Solirubrobacteraceae bacterium]
MPACLSLVLALVFFPLILRLGAASYTSATGRSVSPYLVRWLVLSAAMFVVSGTIYVIRASPRRDRGRADDQPL